MALKLLQPPKLEPITLGTAKNYLKLDHDDDDAFLNNLIKTARKAIEAFTGKCLIMQTWQFSVNSGFASALSDGTYLEGMRSRGKGGIELPKNPFIQLEGDPEIVDDYGHRTIKDFRLDQSGRTARLHFGPSIISLTEGRGVVNISFTVGYGNKVEDVPEPFSHAILIALANLYENRGGPANDNFLVPPALPQSAIDLLLPYRSARLK